MIHYPMLSLNSLDMVFYSTLNISIIADLSFMYSIQDPGLLKESFY